MQSATILPSTLAKEKNRPSNYCRLQGELSEARSESSHVLQRER